MLKERNYWHDTVEMPSGHDQNPLPERVDVAVIGSGFTGLSAALALAKRGTSVSRIGGRVHWLGSQFTQWRHGANRPEDSHADRHQALRA